MAKMTEKNDVLNWLWVMEHLDVCMPNMSVCALWIYVCLNLA